MCTIFLAQEHSPQFPLIVAMNRDESLDRPTAPLHRWGDSAIVAGKDQRGGGTWFGVNANGRFAALTNYWPIEKQNAPSRGGLVSEFLEGSAGAEAYLSRISSQAGLMSGFNLLVGERRNGRWQVAYLSNGLEDGPHLVPPGVHGLSNDLLNSDWPKIRAGREHLRSILPDLTEPQGVSNQLFNLLAGGVDPTAVGHSPDSPLPREIRKQFVFIPPYGGLGTRTSTVLIADRAGELYIEERSFGRNREIESSMQARMTGGEQLEVRAVPPLPHLPREQRGINR